MTAYLSKILTTYNNRYTTPVTYEARKALLHKAFRASFTLVASLYYSVRDNGVIRKLAAYVILGINTEGRKEVLTIQVGDNESSKYWLSVLNELKNRGVKDILSLCADSLYGIKEAISAAFLKTEYQRCIVPSGKRHSEIHHVLS